MEVFMLTIEMTNGESYKYNLESESIEKLSRQINSSAAKWFEINENGETHFINIDNIARWKVISEKDLIAAQEEHSKQMIEAMNNFNF